MSELSTHIKYFLLSTIAMGLLGLSLGSGQLLAQESPHRLGWKPFGIEGDIAYGPVRLDGYELFSIAAILTQGDNSRSGVGGLQMRRRRIEKRLRSQLQYLLDNEIDADELQVITTTLNQQMVVQAVVDGEPSRPIITITAPDSELYVLSEAELATEYAQSIQAGLVRGIAERQPEARWLQARQALVGGAITTLLIGLLYQVEQRLLRQRQQLRQHYDDQQQHLAQQQANLDNHEPLPEALVELKQVLFKLKQQIERKTWQKRILQLGMVSIGLVGLAWILRQFFQTRALGVFLVKQPLALLVLGLGVTLAIFCSRLLINWFLAKDIGLKASFSIPAPQLERRRRRAMTLSEVWKNLFTLLWVIVGIVLAVRLFTLSSGWSATLQLGVLGLVVSLAFQSAIKDALAGFLLLSKDAYIIGDIVSVQDVSGVVETMGLYVTQIRSSQGQLVTLSNGVITTVANHSRDWAKMDLAIWVDHDTDLKQALATMQEVFESMQASPNWSAMLTDRPDILGVDQIDPQGILLRIRAQAPSGGDQWGVTREYRLRLNQAFQTNGIKFALPQRELRYRGSKEIS